MAKNAEQALFTKLNKTISVTLDASLDADAMSAIHARIAALAGIKELQWNIEAHVPPAEAESPDVLYKGLKKHTREAMIEMFGPAKRVKDHFNALARSEKDVEELVEQIAAIDGVIDAHVMHHGPFRGWAPVKPARQP